MAIKNSGFVYRGANRTVESVLRRGQQAGRAYDSYINPDLPTWKVKEGEHQCRIMPPTWDETLDRRWGSHWDIKLMIHWNVGPDNATYLCLDKMQGKRCPVCEARLNAADDQERRDLAPSERRLAWIVDRDDEKAGPQIWSLPPTLYKEIVDRSVDKKNDAVIKIDSPYSDADEGQEPGYDIMFQREGTDKHTDYNRVDVDRDSTPLHKDHRTRARWLDYIIEHPLPGVLNFYDYDYIEQIMYGRKEETAPKGAAEPPRRAARRGEEPEEEEIDSAETGEVAAAAETESPWEEEPAPRPRPAGRFHSREGAAPESTAPRSRGDNGGARAKPEDPAPTPPRGGASDRLSRLRRERGGARD